MNGEAVAVSADCWPLMFESWWWWWWLMIYDARPKNNLNIKFFGFGGGLLLEDGCLVLSCLVWQKELVDASC